MIVAARKYGWVGLTAARSNVAYLGEVATRIIFLSVILYIFLQLWRVTYAETGAAQLGGLTLAQMLWYLMMTEAITLSVPNVGIDVDQDVRTGALAIQLIRPISYPLYRLWTALGEQAVRLIMNVAVGTVLVLLLVGPISFSIDGLLIFLLSVPFALVLTFLGPFLIGLFAFWLEDTSGLRLIYSRGAMILGGMLIPLELFPEALQAILRALPFASMVYGPARLFVKPDLAFLADLLVRQGIAIVIYGILVAIVYRSAVKRINANGG
jgi:ABC-2 type transport system permease protein